MLVNELGVRIEMRQVGIRHKAKMCSGIGRCGRMICCSAFIEKFEPVSIRMAKDQNLSLNPTKISGLCGRLMCCLIFENETYKALSKIISLDPSKKNIWLEIGESNKRQMEKVAINELTNINNHTEV